MTMIEVVLGVAVAAVIVGVSMPLVKGTTKFLHLKAAVPAVSGIIVSTKYQAVMYGCPYQVAFSQTTTSYQVSQQVLSGSPPTCAASFTNVGSATPWSSSGDVSISASITLQFNPNGTISNITSPSTVPATFSLTNGTQTETFTISGVGNVSVSP